MADFFGGSASISLPGLGQRQRPAWKGHQRGDSSVATRLRAIESVLTNHERTINLLVDQISYVFIARAETVKSELAARLAPREGASSQRGSRCSGGSGRTQQKPATTFPQQRLWLSTGAPLCHSDGAIRCGHCRRHTSRSSSSMVRNLAAKDLDRVIFRMRPKRTSRRKDARGSGARCWRNAQQLWSRSLLRLWMSYGQCKEARPTELQISPSSSQDGPTVRWHKKLGCRRGEGAGEENDGDNDTDIADGRKRGRR